MDLAEWLSDQKMTDAAFAEKVGCNQTTINRARRGQTMPDPALIARIVSATAGEVTAGEMYETFMAARSTSSAQRASAA